MPLPGPSRSQAVLATTSEQWHTLLSLLAVASASRFGRPPAWRAACALLSSSHLSPLSAGPCRLLLLRFLQPTFPPDEDEDEPPSPSPSSSSSSSAGAEAGGGEANPYLVPAMARAVQLSASFLAGALLASPQGQGLGLGQRLSLGQRQRLPLAAPAPYTFFLPLGPRAASSSSARGPAEAAKEANKAAAPSPLSPLSPLSAPQGQGLLTVLPLRVSASEAEAVWTDTLRRLAALSLSLSLPPTPRPAPPHQAAGAAAAAGAAEQGQEGPWAAPLGSLRLLLQVGRAARLPLSVWLSGLDELMTRLPLTFVPLGLDPLPLPLPLPQAQGQGAGGAVPRPYAHSPRPDLCRQSCALVLEALVDLEGGGAEGGAARHSPALASHWAGLSRLLAVNARNAELSRAAVPGAGAGAGGGGGRGGQGAGLLMAMIDLAAALLRALRPPDAASLLPTPLPSSSSSSSSSSGAGAASKGQGQGQGLFSFAWGATSSSSPAKPQPAPAPRDAASPRAPPAAPAPAPAPSLPRDQVPDARLLAAVYRGMCTAWAGMAAALEERVPRLAQEARRVTELVEAGLLGEREREESRPGQQERVIEPATPPPASPAPVPVPTPATAISPAPAPPSITPAPTLPPPMPESMKRQPVAVVKGGAAFIV